MCKKRIEIASIKVKGIKMATWDIPSNIIRVIYNPNKVEIKSLQKAIADIGHDTPLFLVKHSDGIIEHKIGLISK